MASHNACGLSVRCDPTLCVWHTVCSGEKRIIAMARAIMIQLCVRSTNADFAAMCHSHSHSRVLHIELPVVRVISLAKVRVGFGSLVSLSGELHLKKCPNGNSSCDKCVCVCVCVCMCIDLRAGYSK